MIAGLAGSTSYSAEKNREALNTSRSNGSLDRKNAASLSYRGREAGSVVCAFWPCPILNSDVDDVIFPAVVGLDVTIGPASAMKGLRAVTFAVASAVVCAPVSKVPAGSDGVGVGKRPAPVESVVPSVVCDGPAAGIMGFGPGINSISAVAAAMADSASKAAIRKDFPFIVLFFMDNHLDVHDAPKRVLPVGILTDRMSRQV